VLPDDGTTYVRATGLSIAEDIDSALEGFGVRY
jgi:hypothetical protein